MEQIKDIQEKTTKDKILDTAMDLFAQKGYFHVTIREIAKAVGIKGSSIYNHFESKEAILDNMFEQYQTETGRILGDFYTEENLDSLIEKHSVEAFLETLLFASVVFIRSPKIEKIFRIIATEQFSNERAKAFFLREFIEVSGNVLETAFTKLMAKGKIKHYDAKELAAEFHAFVIYKFYENYILRNQTDIDYRKMQQEFQAHIRFFSRLIINA